MMTVSVQTIVGGTVALECDFLQGNPLPVIIQWYADGIEINALGDNSILYTDRGRYLYIRALTATMRNQQFHCEVTNAFLNMRAPTTYTLNEDIPNGGLVVYKPFGRTVIRSGVDTSVLIVYASASRTNAGAQVDNVLICNQPVGVDLTFSITGNYLEVRNIGVPQDYVEIMYSCQLLRTTFPELEVTGTIIVEREYNWLLE